MIYVVDGVAWHRKRGPSLPRVPARFPSRLEQGRRPALRADASRVSSSLRGDGRGASGLRRRVARPSSRRDSGLRHGEAPRGSRARPWRRERGYGRERAAEAPPRSRGLRPGCRSRADSRRGCPSTPSSSTCATPRTRWAKLPARSPRRKSSRRYSRASAWGNGARLLGEARKTRVQ